MKLTQTLTFVSIFMTTLYASILLRYVSLISGLISFMSLSATNTDNQRGFKTNPQWNYINNYIVSSVCFCSSSLKCEYKGDHTVTLS